MRLSNRDREVLARVLGALRKAKAWPLPTQGAHHGGSR